MLPSQTDLHIFMLNIVTETLSKVGLALKNYLCRPK